MKGTVLFITGIDTNIGKTFATGMIACALAGKGKRVITQKMIQTGCTEISEDIVMHRKIQGIPFTEEDKAGLTCPYIFTYPCSPHMAAEKDGKTIDLSVITEATRRLQEKYEYVLLEGAGGLMVPNDFHSLDKRTRLPRYSGDIRQIRQYQPYIIKPLRLQATWDHCPRSRLQPLSPYG